MDIQKQMFIANGVHRIAKSDTWEYLTGLKVLLKLNKQNPLDSGKWANGLHSVHAGVRAAPKIPSGQLPNEAALLDKVLSWIGDLHPGAMVIADDVRESLQRDSSVRAMIENESGRAAFARSFVYNNVAPEASAILGEIYDITQQNSQVKSIWDSLMARDLGSISATPDQIVMENPELAGLLTIIGKTPDVEVSLNFVKNMVESLTSELGSNSDKIELLNGQVHSASTALETLVGEAAAGKLMQEESIRQKTREDALRGAVALYGLFGGDTQTVWRLNAVLNAYTGTRSAVDAYNAAILAKSGQAAASLALAGAWVGVALTLAAAFSEDEGKSAEQQVLDAIGNLSKQLTDIQTQISQSFKYIDDRLTILSRDMAIGFDAVLTGIQANRFHLRELLSASYGLAVQLDTSTTLLVNKLDYAIEVLAYEPVSKFVNWKRVTGRPLKPEQVDEAAAAVTSLANCHGPGGSPWMMEDTEGVRA